MFRGGDHMETGFQMITDKELSSYILQSSTLIVDLRNPEDYRAGHIPGAVNIPFDALETQLYRLDYYKQILLYCDRGNVSLLAARNLSKKGYPVIDISGGIHSYTGEIVAQSAVYGPPS